MPTLNWCYGAYAPVENMQIVDEQLRLAHKYANRLVELERARRVAAETAARKLSPEFDKALKQYRDAEDAVDAAYAAVKASRAKARARVQPTPEQQAAITAAKQARRVAAEQLDKHKSAAYKALTAAQNAHKASAETSAVVPAGATETIRKRLVRRRFLEILEEQGLSAGQLQHEDAVRDARADSGLFWGTYLFVEDATKNITKGPPPRFRKFTGNGSVAIQLQGGLTVDEAVSGNSQNLRLFVPVTERMELTGKDRGKQARAEAWLRVGSDDSRRPIWARIPFVYHRKLPADAVIKWAFIDRRRVGHKYEWRLRLTLETRNERKRPDNADIVAVHMGYRAVDGGIRVACVIDSNGSERQLVMSRSDVEAFKKPSDLRAIRDTLANAVLAELIPWFDRVSVSPDLGEQIARMPQWNGADRLQRFMALWKTRRFTDDTRQARSALPSTFAWAESKLFEYSRNPGYRPRHPDNVATVFGLMEFWRKFDKHLAEWAANQTRKSIARREQLYRTFVADLRRNYGTCAIAKIDWHALRAKPKLEASSEPTAAIRNMASVAAPGRLTEIIKEVFGADLTIVEAKNITATCAHCQTALEFDRTVLLVRCDKCSTTIDQDFNAVRNTLARATSGVQELQKV